MEDVVPAKKHKNKNHVQPETINQQWCPCSYIHRDAFTSGSPEDYIHSRYTQQLNRLKRNTDNTWIPSLPPTTQGTYGKHSKPLQTSRTEIYNALHTAPTHPPTRQTNSNPFMPGLTLLLTRNHVLPLPHLWWQPGPHHHPLLPSFIVPATTSTGALSYPSTALLQNRTVFPSLRQRFAEHSCGLTHERWPVQMTYLVRPTSWQGLLLKYLTCPSPSRLLPTSFKSTTIIPIPKQQKVASSGPPAICIPH